MASDRPDRHPQAYAEAGHFPTQLQLPRTPVANGETPCSGARRDSGDFEIFLRQITSGQIELPPTIMRGPPSKEGIHSKSPC